MNLSCVFDPAACATGVVTGWLDWFPFGASGLIFVAGMIVGAILGKWGVGALVAALVALKFAPKRVSTEEQYGIPVPQPKRRRTTIFDGLRRK